MTTRATEYPNFSMEVRSRDGGRTVVAVRGEIDMVTAPAFRETLSEHLQAGQVVLDLRGVEFMDSSGVAALDRLLKEADASGTRFVVCEPIPRPVAHILEMTGMFGVLALEPCEDEA